MVTRSSCRYGKARGEAPHDYGCRLWRSCLAFMAAAKTYGLTGVPCDYPRYKSVELQGKLCYG